MREDIYIVPNVPQDFEVEEMSEVGPDDDEGGERDRGVDFGGLGVLYREEKTVRGRRIEEERERWGAHVDALGDGEERVADVHGKELGRRKAARSAARSSRERGTGRTHDSITDESEVHEVRAEDEVGGDGVLKERKGRGRKETRRVSFTRR